MKQSKLIATLLFMLTLVTTTSCKQESDNFDLLIGGDNSTTVEDLEITSRLPDQAEVILRVGESEGFSISAIAPNSSLISYSWTLDGAVQGAGQTYTFSATAGLIGDHTLVASASDGTTTKQNSWTIRVNGPPVITPTVTTTQKTAVGSMISISATATDPNNDSLSYAWTLDGATSAYLTGTTGTGTLTGH
ncbi:MAG: hypothetical protein HRT44_05980, partial [Bdellovibrionales bacterium]|nr:hypothetical protein [Bdellovibrionales bacterium]NQZ18791.1 hypothetical protein [Bdellovibrionales bacterium]